MEGDREPVRDGAAACLKRKKQWLRPLDVGGSLAMFEEIERLGGVRTE